MSSANIVAVFLLSVWMLVDSGAGVARAAENPQAAGQRNKAIKAALEKLGDGEVPTYEIGWSDLDGDGTPEAIVLMKGAEWCGTGGCTLVVLKQDAASWKVLSRIPTSRSPVVLLDGKTNGWRDLALGTQGGGDSGQKMTVLKFQKNRYVKHPETAIKGGRQAIIP